jgi:glycosyltransferase involved in cell wall biosynthesis
MLKSGMKILQVAHGFPPQSLAGTEIYTQELSKELLKNNEVCIFYRVSDRERKEYELRRGSYNGLNTFTVNNTFRFCDSFEKFYRNYAICEQFSVALDEVKPDIVHIQHLIFLSTTMIEAAKRRGIPVVFTLHDYWLICPQWHFLKKGLGICPGDDISECAECLDYQLSIKKLPKSIYVRFRRLIPGSVVRAMKEAYLGIVKQRLNSPAYLEKIAQRKAHIKELCSAVDMFISPSLFLRKKFIDFGIPEAKIRFMPHGVNKGYFKGLKRKRSDKVRFGFIGTILPAKGVDILVKAFNMVPGDQAELKIYGKLFSYTGFEHYPRDLKRIVKNGNIRFMGEFNHNDIAGVFSGIDVLIIPSIWNENCPLTILEAFSAGTPVIASNIGGMPELIKDGENGLLVEPGSPDGLYDKIKALIDNPDLMERLKKGAREPKGVEDNALEIEMAYKELLNEKV